MSFATRFERESPYLNESDTNARASTPRFVTNALFSGRPSIKARPALPPRSGQLIVEGCEVKPGAVSEACATGGLTHPIGKPSGRAGAETGIGGQAKLSGLTRHRHLVAKPDLVEPGQEIVVIDQSEECRRLDRDVVVSVAVECTEILEEGNEARQVAHIRRAVDHRNERKAPEERFIGYVMKSGWNVERRIPAQTKSRGHGRCGSPRAY